MSSVPVSTASLLVDYDCEADLCPTGIGDSPMAGFPTAGGTFGILTSGNAGLADNPNDDTGSGYSWGYDGPPIATVHDQQVVKIDLGPATGTCLAFDFRFLSEEFPEYVTAGFNDAFVAQLNTLNVAVSGQSVVAPGDFAAGAGDAISVDAAGPSAMTPAQAAGTTYDGATLPLVARKAVAVGSVNTLYLTIFDQGDSILDSAVFVDNIRYESPANPALCKSLSLDPYEGTTGVELVAGHPPVYNPTAITIPLTCNLPPGPIGCPVAAAVSFVTWGDALPARKATTLLASGAATIPAGATGAIVAPTNPTGVGAVKAAQVLPKKLKQKAKKLLKKAKKLRAKAETVGAVKAAKLLKKADKLTKKAKKLKKRANKLLKQPLGTMSIRITNSSNGVSMVRNVTIPR